MSYPKDSTRAERRKFAKERHRKSLENELERIRPVVAYAKSLEQKYSDLLEAIAPVVPFMQEDNFKTGNLMDDWNAALALLRQIEKAFKNARPSPRP